MSPGCVGCHPSRSRVSALEARTSSARKPASHPKCSPACSGAIDVAGRWRCRPITSAIARAPHALLGGAVQRRSRRSRLQRQAEQARGVEPVHRGQVVLTLAEVAGDHLVARDGDEGRDEAVVAVAAPVPVPVPVPDNDPRPGR